MPTDLPDESLEEVERGAADRLTFFSDAVVAIAMTLLALELPLPEGRTAAELWHSAVHENFDAYLAFCLSFVVIASYWTAHHRLFRWVRRSDDRLRWLDLWWLFFIVVMPFITRVISEGGGADDTTQPVRFAAYAGVQVLINLVFIAMALHLRRAGLLRPVTPPELVDNALWGSGAVAVGFALSIPLFFVIPWAWVLWIVRADGNRAGARPVRVRLGFFRSNPTIRTGPESPELRRRQY